jgi:hypothetical protein
VARLNLDEGSRHDPRILRLSRRTGEARQTTLGRLTDVWWLCLDRRSAVVEVEDVDTAAELDGFAALMVESRLADPAPGGDRIRVRGIEDRIGYLATQSERGRRGGAARAASAQRDDRGRVIGPGQRLDDLQANAKPTPGDAQTLSRRAPSKRLDDLQANAKPTPGPRPDTASISSAGSGTHADPESGNADDLDTALNGNQPHKTQAVAKQTRSERLEIVQANAKQTPGRSPGALQAPLKHSPDLPPDLPPDPDPDLDLSISVGGVGGADRSPPKATRAKKPRRAETPIPEGWIPDATATQLAADLGLDRDREALAFRDHALTRARVAVDWQAAFRTWLRKSSEFRRDRPTQPQPAAPRRASSEFTPL